MLMFNRNKYFSYLKHINRNRKEIEIEIEIEKYFVKKYCKFKI